ncbi:MAG: hypothetical protein HYX20_03415 [Candidatus Yanofskybacteria bacterium]|nr:hypothetical protein [Candidatus Yanofskybacteria bacterium]
MSVRNFFSTHNKLLLIILFGLALFGTGYFALARTSSIITIVNERPAHPVLDGRAGRGRIGGNSGAEPYCYNGDNNLGQLIVLDSLFGTDYKKADGSDRFSRLERLIVLDRLFSNQSNSGGRSCLSPLEE